MLDLIDTKGKKDIKSMTLEEVTAEMTALGEKSFRAKQLYDWLHVKLAESFDDMSVEEKGKYYVNGYMMEYDNNRKANIPVPVTVAIPVAAEDADEKAKKRIEAIKHKFIVEDDGFKEYGVIVNMLNGAQRVEITEDMLTDEQKNDLDCGLITMNIAKEFMVTESRSISL